jgi:hypothetical protein
MERILQRNQKEMLIRLPTSILMISKLSKICIYGYHLKPHQFDKQSCIVSSKANYIELSEDKLTDLCLLINLKRFANVAYLNLSLSNITILPECIKEQRSLRILKLDDCMCLQEIRGIPPNLKCLSALNCKSLSSSCRSMLLNQVFLFFLYLTSYFIEYFMFLNLIISY